MRGRWQRQMIHQRWTPLDASNKRRTNQWRICSLVSNEPVRLAIDGVYQIEWWNLSTGSLLVLDCSFSEVPGIQRSAKRSHPKRFRARTACGRWSNAFDLNLLIGASNLAVCKALRSSKLLRLLRGVRTSQCELLGGSCSLGTLLKAKNQCLLAIPIWTKLDGRRAVQRLFHEFIP